jgi:hypothetical protein
LQSMSFSIQRSRSFTTSSETSIVLYNPSARVLNRATKPTAFADSPYCNDRRAPSPGFA